MADIDYIDTSEGNVLDKQFPDLDGIFPVAIPLPGYSDLITANIYILGSGPYVMIDTGPKFPGSFEFAVERLERRGIDIADIERIIITHGHIDHFGLANSFRKEAGRDIECYVHSEDMWRISSLILKEEMWGREAEELVERIDMPESELEKFRLRFQLMNHDATAQVKLDAIACNAQVVRLIDIQP